MRNNISKEALIFWEVIERFFEHEKLDSSYQDNYFLFDYSILEHYRFKLSTDERKVLSQKYNNYYISARLNFYSDKKPSETFIDPEVIIIKNVNLFDSGQVIFTEKNKKEFIQGYIKLKNQILSVNQSGGIVTQIAKRFK